MTKNNQAKMAVVEGAAGDIYYHLQNVLSISEISSITNNIAEKLNKYIDDKFGEYLTSKALHETGKSLIENKIAESDAKIQDLNEKCKEANVKIITLENINSNLQNEVNVLNSKLEASHEKNLQFENEVLTLKCISETSIDERNELTRVVERRNSEIERLKAITTDLSLQLQGAVDAKCEALTQINELQSKELALQQSEKRMEQERLLLNSQISALSEEVNRLTNESQTVTVNNSSKILHLETKLKETMEELVVCNETITQLNETKTNLNNKIETLTQRLEEQTKLGSQLTTNYKNELDIKTKTTDLYKSLHVNTEIKATELIKGIAELQNLLQIATEKYGELETKYKQTQIDYDIQIDKNNEIISSLKNELDHANDLLTSVNNKNFDTTLNDLTPLSANKVIKSGMTLTQMYTELVNVTNELSHEKEECKHLKLTINEIIQELEEKAPALAKTKFDLQESTESNIILTKQIDSLTMEMNKCRHEVKESSALINNYKHENLRLEGEIADLQNQICFLLRDIEHRPRLISNGDHDASNRYANQSTDNNSSKILSKSLLQFSNIQELQSNYQKLLRVVKDLTEKLEQLELNKQQFESGEYQQKIETMEKKILELIEAQDRHTKMANEIIKQRDLYKKLYHDLTQKSREISTEEDNIENVGAAMEIKLIKTQQQLEDVKNQLEACKNEKLSSEKELNNKIDILKKKIDKLVSDNNNSLSTAEYNKEQLKALQKNNSTIKVQLNELAEKYKASNLTISKQEISLQYFRTSAETAEQKLSSANLLIEKYKTECQILRDRDLRLQSENESLIREQQKQETVLKYLESIKNNLDYVENESRTKLQSRLEDAKRECTAIRRRLEEEQNLYREHELRFKEEIGTAQLLLLKEKEKTEVLKKENMDLELKLDSFKQSYNEVNQQISRSDNDDKSLYLIKKNKELEDIIIQYKNEIKTLKEQLLINKQHVKQYSNISENAEKALRKVNDEYINYKTEAEQKITDYCEKIRNLQEHSAELEAELSLQSNGDNITTLNMKLELEKMSSELVKSAEKLQISEQQLNATCIEMEKKTSCLVAREERITQLELEHSTNIHKLNQCQLEITHLQNQCHELTILKEEALKNLIFERTAWEQKQTKLTADYEELNLRFINLDSQNTLLLNQVQSLGVQLSLSNTGHSLNDNINELNNSNVNTSMNEDVQICSEQFLEIVKFLRNEKDFAVAKCNELHTEIINLKSKLEVTEKELSDAKVQPDQASNIIYSGNTTVLKQSDIIKKIEALDALTDSNRVLKSERDELQLRVNDLSNTVNILQKQLSPINDKVKALSNKNESLESENHSLKNDSTRWKNRVNALVERTNKTNAEDWKRLQNERENLSKQVNTEKEFNKKTISDLNAVKVEKTKLEEQLTILSRQNNTLAEDHKKLNEEMQNISVECSTLKADILTVSKNNDKLETEISNKDKVITEITTKELQMRKIAKKYKNQYEELLKNTEDEKNKPNVNDENNELLELQNQLEAEKANVEKLQTELQSSVDKEVKAKQLLKVAKSKIFQLTETKNNLTRELEETQKIENLDHNKQEEMDERLAVIKSQFDSKISKLEKENTEILINKEKEIESLLQKINLLQRQLANQANISKQATTEKALTEPPTANIKPMAACAVASVSASGAGAARRAGEPPLASIRPVAQVGPTAPHDTHSTEYMPASSSRPRADDADAAPEAGPPPQQVALVLPRVEPPGSAPPGPPAPPTDVSTSRPPDRPPKRPRAEPRGPLSKRQRAEPDDYQLPTSSQRDRDDEAPQAPTPDEPEQPAAEAISSGTEPVGALSPGADDGDDGIVPSTPTLYVPRRGDVFGEAAVSPAPAPVTAGGARFTFAEAGAASHHDTHADLALPTGEWRDEGAVSSQGSAPASPRHVEEGREAEASATPPDQRRRARWPPLR